MAQPRRCQLPYLPVLLFADSRGLRMACIFLSYDRDGAGIAPPIAAALEKVGHSVWWDKHISGGSEFSKEIEQALDKADVIVDQLYDFLDQWPIDEDLDGITYLLFRAWMVNVRRDPRFMRLAQRVGLLDYWKKSGKGPDFCAEPDMPYDCKKEAAKLKPGRLSNN